MEGEVSFRAARGWDFLSCEIRSTAAGPVTFFVLPKKVTKERRACEDAACGGSLRCSERTAGPANSLRSDSRPRLPRPPLRCSASSKAIQDSPLTLALSPSGERERAFPPLRGGPGRGGVAVPALEDAEQRSEGRGRRGLLSERSEFASPAGPREQRREARRAVFVGAPFFAYFLWQDKESRRPRGRGADLSTSNHAARAQRATSRTC